MLTNMIFLSPAAMAPAVSASNDAAAAILARAADAPKTFSAATAQAATATTAATTAAAMAVVRACAAAASACGAALTALWERCQLALQHLFGGAATQEAAPCMCTCACVSETTAPTVPMDTDTDTDTAVLAKIPTPAPSLAATATPKDVADSSELLVAASTDEDCDDAPTDATVPTVPTVTTDGCAHAIGIANETEEEEEPAPALVLPQELAEHEPVVDESIMARYRSQLMARHAALGRTPVPSDTVLLIISWLVAQNRGQAFLLAYPFAIVDIVLRALAWHDHDVAATVGGLARHWMRDYRCMRILRKLAPTRRHEVDALRLKLSTAYAAH